MRSIIALTALLALSACADPALEKRVSDLEARLQAAEANPGAGPARAGKANPKVKRKASPVNSEEEQAAAQLLKAANDLAESGDYTGAKKTLAELKAKYPQTRAQRAAARLESELQVIGQPAGQMQVAKWYSAPAAFGDSKATLLVFWEVWCPHCKREVPKLEATYQKFKGKGLNVVGLTKQTRNITDDQVTAFIKDHGISYQVGKEQGDAMSQHFGVRGIPAAAVVKDGKIVWRGHPARISDDMINGWLNG